MFVEAAGELTSYSRAEVPSNVSQSADGQILVLTHGLLHILTPGLGLSVREDRSALSGYPGNKLPDQWSADEKHEDFQPGECSGLPIFKTSIPVPKRSIEWEEITIDSRLTVAGALDNGWRMASWSPSGLSQEGWCLLAALTVNCEVYIYGPGSDAVKSVWQEVFDLTSVYLEALRKDPFLPYSADTLTSGDEQKAKRDQFTMQAQSTSVAWSHSGPAHAVRDDSVLAVGHKSGHVTFWRHQSSCTLTMLTEQKVLDQWPLLMSWSQWTSTINEQNQSVFSSLLAVAGASGHVQLLSVSLLEDGRIECSPFEAVAKSPKAVTALKWLDNRTLAIGRLTDITIWKPTTIHRLAVPIEDFRGWTSIPSPIDFVDLPKLNTMITAMSDGTLRQVSDVAPAAPRLRSLQEAKPGKEGSLALCEDLRRTFMTLAKTGSRSKNKAPIPSTASMQLSSFTQLDREGTVFWAYEAHQLDRRLYLMPNLRKVSFAIARWNDVEPEERLIRGITFALTSQAKIGCSESSQKTLFPVMLVLRHLMDRGDFLVRLTEAVIDLVDLTYVPSLLGCTDEDYLSFLLGDSKVQVLRLGILILQYVYANAEVEAARQKCQNWLRQSYLAIYTLIFRALDGLLSSPAADSADALVKQRYAKVLGALEAAPSESRDMDGQASNVETFPTDLDEEEKCAACNAVIPFRELGKGTCRNGHAWVRCSVTMAVMFTASARTCTVCSRKSHIPRESSSSLNESLAQKALRAAKYCLCCGGRWTDSA